MGKQSTRKNQKRVPANSARPVVTASSGKTSSIVPLPAEHKTGKYGRWLPQILLMLVFLIAFVSCFTDKIDIGGDNIHYYNLGKALASGYGYVDIVNPSMLPNNHFPPGYPFIISIFMRLGFEELTFFYRLNGVFAALSVLVLYHLLRRLSFDLRLAFAVCFFTALNVGILSFSVNNMSEVPYIFFSLLTLLLLTYTNFSKPVYKDMFFILMVLVAAGVYYIRTTGIALVLAILVFLAIKRRWSHLLSFATVFFLCILPWQLRSSALGGNSYMKQLVAKNPYAPELGPAGFSDFVQRALSNFSRYISTEIPSAITGRLFQNYDNLTAKDWAIGVTVVLLIAGGIVKLLRSARIWPMLLYVFFTAGILLLWSEKWRGIRFMLPLVPLLLFFTIYFLNLIAEALFRKMRIPWSPFVLCFLVIFMLPSLRKLSFVGQMPYPQNYKHYFDLATWVKFNTPENSIICCRKPELFYLFSGRRSVSYPFTQNEDSLLSSLEQNKVDYVVVEQLGFSSTGKYLTPVVNKNMNKRFKMLRISKKPETYFLSFNRNGVYPQAKPVVLPPPK